MAARAAPGPPLANCRAMAAAASQLPVMVGLSTDSARGRLAVHGPNEIERDVAVPMGKRLLQQLASPLVCLLLGACVVSALLGEVADAVAIGVIVVVNAAVGMLQEARAERALLALRSMTAPRARVLREGRQHEVPAREVVPGDVLLLEAGDVVAADGRILTGQALTTNEAALTGESAPVEKRAAASAPDAPLAERHDRVFMGTFVASGTATAEVDATGMATELGKIAHLLASASEEQTPLQRRLAGVGRLLLTLCLAVVAVTAALGFVRGRPPLEVLLAAISLAVAAVPEGLPAIVTIALAIGVSRMAARSVLVRKLPALETLGSATVICTDKTGTLTTGVMAVREIWGADHDQVVAAGAACCDAQLGSAGHAGIGDPTELAILSAAFDRGILREQIEATRPRLTTVPFDPERRRMAVLRADDVLYVKGALEAVAPLCRTGTEGAAQAALEMASGGLRVLAVALGDGPEEAALRLVGLLGIADPPRSEAIEAVAAARAAGIRTVMITGDHPSTAAAIAREMGILTAHDRADEVVHARATPADKLRIVRQWKARGAIVAMTGDGANDAPALREAHIGVAMGKTGTEVTREASDMVLADDNFASLIAAVREGRGIFDNIRKTLIYLLAGNTAELLVMLGAAALGAPLPLLPLHLLWVNLVTDGMPALALVMDPAAEDVMRRPPRPPQAPMLGPAEWRQVLVTGLLEAAVVLTVFLWAVRAGDVVTGRSMAFTTLVSSELFRAFGARHPHRTLWEVGAFTNLRLLAVVALSLLVQIGIGALPFTARLFQLENLTPWHLALSLALGAIPVTAIEVTKLVRRAR
jgi:Ca2+-transporting ATPase